MDGINLQNLRQFTQLQSVIAVGGSWPAAKALIAENDYQTIRSNIIEAVQAVWS